MYHETPKQIPDINMYINNIISCYQKIYKENIGRRVMPAFTYIRMPETHILEKKNSTNIYRFVY